MTLFDSPGWHHVSYGQVNNGYAKGILWRQVHSEKIVATKIPRPNIPWLILWVFLKELCIQKKSKKHTINGSDENVICSNTMETLTRLLKHGQEKWCKYLAQWRALSADTMSTHLCLGFWIIPCQIKRGQNMTPSELIEFCEAAVPNSLLYDHWNFDSRYLRCHRTQFFGITSAFRHRAHVVLISKLIKCHWLFGLIHHPVLSLHQCFRDGTASILR